MRFGSTAKVLLKCKLKYYRISECNGDGETVGRKDHHRNGVGLLLATDVAKTELKNEELDSSYLCCWASKAPTQHSMRSCHEYVFCITFGMLHYRSICRMLFGFQLNAASGLDAILVIVICL